MISPTSVRLANSTNATPVFRGRPRFGNQPVPNAQQRMNELALKYPVMKTMFDLIDIPSATPQQDPRHAQAIETQMNRMRDLITGKLQAIGIQDIQRDPNGTLMIRVPGSPGYENARPLMLTAHMDIVPGDPSHPTKPIQRTVVQENGDEWIATDGTTTLGADDKGGLAMILDLLTRLQGKHPAQATPLAHVPLEILLSPDEESSCNSLRQLDTSQFKAKQVLVVDEFEPFQVTTGLASSVQIDIQVDGIQGGHSGEDINKPNRVNAVMMLSELAGKLGTGVIESRLAKLVEKLKRAFWRLTGQQDKLTQSRQDIPTISKNIGQIEGGSAPNAIPESGSMRIMLRSHSPEAQARELARIERVVRQLEARYQKQQPGLKIHLAVDEEYPAWQGDPRSPIPEWGRQAARNIHGPEVRVGAVHAAAQASILANKTNAHGERFDAALIGPYIKEAHTVRERIEVDSLIEVNRWLGEIVRLYTRQQAAQQP